MERTALRIENSLKIKPNIQLICKPLYAHLRHSDPGITLSSSSYKGKQAHMPIVGGASDTKNHFRIVLYLILLINIFTYFQEKNKK